MIEKVTFCKLKDRLDFTYRDDDTTVFKIAEISKRLGKSPFVKQFEFLIDFTYKRNEIAWHWFFAQQFDKLLDTISFVKQFRCVYKGNRKNNFSGVPIAQQLAVVKQSDHIAVRRLLSNIAQQYCSAICTLSSNSTALCLHHRLLSNIAQQFCWAIAHLSSNCNSRLEHAPVSP